MTPSGEIGNSPTRRDHGDKEGDGSPQQKAIISNAVPSPPPPGNESEYRLYTHTPWWKTLAELIGVAAVIWYASITHNMWKEMQSQTALQNKALASAERPFVGVDGPPQVQINSMQPGKFGATMLITLRNFGQRPALGVMGPAMSIVTSNVDESTQTNCNLIFPFVGLTPTRQLGSSEDISKHHWGQVIFPSQPFRTGDNWSNSSASESVIGKEAYVVGCVAYKDQLNQPHWTKFCYNTGDYASDVVKDARSFEHLYACNTNNYTDDTEKK